MHTVEYEEGFNRLDIKAGKLVDSICFTDVDGDAYGHLGGNGGRSYVESAPRGEVLIGFTGRAGKYLDALEPVWGDAN